MEPACTLTTIVILVALLLFVLMLLNRTMELCFTTSYAMVDCTPPPSSDDVVAPTFRDTLLPLLAALPGASVRATPCRCSRQEAHRLRPYRESKHGCVEGMKEIKEATNRIISGCRSVKVEEAMQGGERPKRLCGKESALT
ncbi:hypothetical protein VPH35_136023 [Triticum aestivum]